MWGPNTITYVSFFIALYFESFLLVTFLSEPARKRRLTERNSNTAPSVAIIVPCFNEENTIASTTESLLKLEYPKENLSIILVDDGSTDNTANVMARYARHPRIFIHTKENGGKHTALNAGIRIAKDADIIGCLDADSFVEPDALGFAITAFDRPEVMATTSAMSVHAPKNLIQHMQYAEYIFGITMRHILSSMNSLYVTPGPFSLYRMEVFKKIGYFSHGYQTEDMEMALRMQKAHMLIENSPRVRVYTKAPSTITALIKQRMRWTSGFLRNMLFEYRGLIGNPRYGVLGIGVLPLSIFSIITVAGLFLFSVFQIISNMIHMFIVSRGIPLSYILTPHTFDWFYFPITTLLLVGIVLMSMTIIFMIIGKQISRTPGKLTKSTASYILLYWIISPIWLVRAIADTITNTHHTWR
ncbi:MAG TPA: glycosyltransferase [Candidatus Kaiserbacteria bacterium]|nr:glycosyltransferase [Candidatus Kaiserbacteria bacterium]